MAIDSIGYSATTTAASTSANTAANTKATDKPAEENKETTTTAATSEAAVYEPSGKQKNQQVSASDIRRMLDETNKQTDALREMILKMINRQAGKDGVAKGQKADNGMIEIDAETRKKAQEDIAEGGYYSVEKTGDRILSFAFAIAGDDPKKLEQMRTAALKGFEEAEKVWGGKLPSISYDTMEYVKKGFDDKMASINGSK